MNKMEGKKIFLVEGEIKEKDGKRPFSKKVEAKTATFAGEKVLCLFGSKNRVKRNMITITKAEEVKEDGKKQGN